jgi:aminomethyltransferase
MLVCRFTRFKRFCEQFGFSWRNPGDRVIAPAPELKKTPLNAAHRRMGGRMVDFGGWEMPVQYPTGTIEEHLRTRTHAGLFDVSHMGEIDVSGPDAIAFINYITSNDVSKLIDGQAQYSALTTTQGTVIDDLLVYRFAPDQFMLVVNAGTTDKDWDWITSHRNEKDD